MLSTKLLCFIAIAANSVYLTNAGLIFYNQENDTEADVRSDFRDLILPIIRTYQELAEDLNNLNSKPNNSDEQENKNNSNESSEEDKIEFTGVRISVLCTDDDGQENSTLNFNGTKCNVQQSKYSGWINLDPDSKENSKENDSKENDSKENDGNSTTITNSSSTTTSTTTTTTPKVDLKDKVISNSNSTENEISETNTEEFPY